MVAFNKWLALLGLAAVGAAQDDPSIDWPVHDNNITKLVQWDHHSFFVNGQRLFVFSGEFHYFRIPVPELWRDILEKVKAAGFNAFSIYNSWGYHNPVPGVIDFTHGAHNFTSIMTLAKELGMYLIIRPGPYINAEANGGGFPLWITTGEYGGLRDDDPRYKAAWEPYMSAIANVIRPHLITNGGNVILYQLENELNGQWKDIEKRVDNPPIQTYMQDLYDNARKEGIDVPLTHNAPNMFGYSWSRDFSSAKGNMDVVGLDSYPSCWSCNLDECTGTNGEYVAYQVQNYYDYFVKQSPTQPNFMPELQGGSYNPWGGPEGGCPSDIGVDFANMFYRNLIYQRITAVSLYMLFGGTNWGNHGAPIVATSYDYSAPISENRVLWDKYYETKLLTQFTRIAHDLPYTNRLGNSTAYSTNPAIAASELRNPETNAAFYVVMHAYSPSATLDTFQLKVNTSAGELTIPQHGASITINGHQAKILPTDFRFGDKTLLYSTAEVLTHTAVDGKEIIALWVPTGESGEFVVRGAGSANVLSCRGCEDVKIIPHVGKDEESVAVSFRQNAGMSVVGLNDGAKMVLLDRQSAYRFWSPSLSADPQSGPDKNILIQGPYLVRSAFITEDGTCLELKGDLVNATAISVFAPEAIKTLTWNGKEVAITSRENGIIVGELVGVSSSSSFELPLLTGWKVADGLPEIEEGYDALGRAWIVANKSTTANPTQPAPNNPVLYADDYGVHAGTQLFRGIFPTTPTPPTDVFLSLSGGTAFGYSAWLNGGYIGSWHGNASVATQNVTLSFSNATLMSTEDDSAKENVLLVVMDNMGHDQRSQALNPRGILNATLISSATQQQPQYSFTSWKIAGTAGSDTRAVLDPVRGFLAEGGLYGERVGAHLPGFPDGEWEAYGAQSPAPSRRSADFFLAGQSGSAATPDAGAGGGGAVSRLRVPGAGMRIFRTSLPGLAVPTGVDVSVSFRLSAPNPGQNRLRAWLFVNGYQYGRFVPHVGNQVVFPVPPGILDYSASKSLSTTGGNTIAVMVWSQDAAGAEVDVEWSVDYVHETSFDLGFDASGLRPGWDESRLEYA